MDIQEFRIAHSDLVEQYQYIEFHLKGIYGSLSGKTFSSGVSEVETYNIRKLLLTIKKWEIIKEFLFLKMMNLKD